MEEPTTSAPGPTFLSISEKYKWKEIPNCPGRYVPQKASSFIDKLTPSELISPEGVDLPVHSFQPKKERRDPLLVVFFPADHGGIISYVKEDRYVHTLNTASGFRRKLTDMDIGVHLLPPIEEHS